MKGTIFICDDDDAIRAMARAILEADGWEVVSAEDGVKGAGVIEEKLKKFTAAVLDVNMPGMSGLDLLTRIRLDAHYQGMPVMMLTGETKDQDIMAGYSQGADYYITKPFTRQQLLHGLSIVLGTSEG